MCCDPMAVITYRGGTPSSVARVNATSPATTNPKMAMSINPVRVRNARTRSLELGSPSSAASTNRPTTVAPKSTVASVRHPHTHTAIALMGTQRRNQSRRELGLLERIKSKTAKPVVGCNKRATCTGYNNHHRIRGISAEPGVVDLKFLWLCGALGTVR
jgi:hypothetical protein